MSSACASPLIPTSTLMKDQQFLEQITTELLARPPSPTSLSLYIPYYELRSASNSFSSVLKPETYLH